MLRQRTLSILLAGITAAIIAASCVGGAGLPSTNTAAAAVSTAPADSTTGAATNPSHATQDAAETVERPAGWIETSHSNDADPDYGVVFPQAEVNQITITIAPEDWEAMQANMTELFGEAGTGQGTPGDRGNRQPPGSGMQPPGGGIQPPEGMQRPEDGIPPPEGMRPPEDEMQPPAGMQPPPRGAFEGGGRGGPGGMGGNSDMTPVNPDWVEATVTFNGETWTHVGVRYKGNSTLTRAWGAGSAKLPLKLDFDQFEDAYPEIKNQRFYGFKQFSLGNNGSDATYLRDSLSYDIMRAAGLITPETAFYEVVLDYGEGPVSLGIYTVVEVVDDTVVERAFGDDDGNIYEADGAAASLAAGTEDQIEASFQKENNEDAADWSDIRTLYDALHAAERTTDPAAWRAGLEAVFDVDAFLKWLAASTAIADWDAYGAMSHNYYLYHDPATGRLVWISWDHNEALGASGRGDTSLDKASVGENWPLIRFLLDDPVYAARYADALVATLTDAFVPEALAAKIDTLAEMLRPYAEKSGDEQAFEAAITQLKAFIAQRAAQVQEYLTPKN